MSQHPLAYYLDDDADDLEFLGEALEMYDYKVKLFSDADKFLRALGGPKLPSIMFVDFNLGKVTGCEVLKCIRADGRLDAIPLVIYSTAGNYGTIRSARECGANMYLTKPTSMPMLMRAVRNIAEIDWAKRVITETNFVYLT